MGGRAPPEVARSISNGGRVSERASGWGGGEDGRAGKRQIKCRAIRIELVTAPSCRANNPTTN